MGRGVGERAEAESFKVPCSHSGSAINWLFVLVPFYHLFKKKKRISRLNIFWSNLQASKNSFIKDQIIQALSTT